MTGSGEALLFWILGPLSVLGALGLIFARKAVHAALGMVVTMIILGIFYLVQEAHFVGVIQIFVYTGAVMMLFLFVVMLVGVDSSDSIVETLKGQRAAATFLSLAMGGLLISSIVRVNRDLISADGLAEVTADPGNVTAVAELIFGRYVWVFEAISALVVTAALAAMILAHRERLGPKISQRAMSEKRIRSGENVAGLPAPGVYARHNAVDTPALLPDGSPSELSISRVLVARDQVLTTPGNAPAVGHADGDTGDQHRTADAESPASNASELEEVGSPRGTELGDDDGKDPA